MDADLVFWANLDQLLNEGQVVVDRPRGSAHPRYTSFVYPLDYGYLAGTRAADGSGVDVWRGSRRGTGITGIVCTVDMRKRDVELKILLDCTMDEAQWIIEIHREGMQSAIFLERPGIQEQES